MNVKVYLRSVIKDKRECLAMFDSNGHGDINNLETEVCAGESIFWQLDDKPRIKKIVKIWPRDKNSKIFNHPFKEGSDLNVIELFIPKDTEPGLEAYNIECIAGDHDVNLVIDPYIRVLPPDTKG
jgi:hypothetical protein